MMALNVQGQPVQPHSLISVFVVYCLNSIKANFVSHILGISMAVHSTAILSVFSLVLVAEQTRLSIWRIFTFFVVNTKYISSSVLKTSEFS